MIEAPREEAFQQRMETNGTACRRSTAATGDAEKFVVLFRATAPVQPWPPARLSVRASPTR